MTFTLDGIDYSELRFDEFIWLNESRCVSCRYWEGDRRREHKNFVDSNGTSMDYNRGWPNEGRCSLAHSFTETEINGDAWVTLRFNANFGCLHWQEFNP